MHWYFKIEKEIFKRKQKRKIRVFVHFLEYLAAIPLKCSSTDK